MSMAPAAIAGNLASITGPGNVIADAAPLAAYRAGGKTPGIAVRPETDEQIAAVVRFAASEKLALIPLGSGSKLSMNFAVREYGFGLDMSRLDRIVSYDPDDLTISVQAGMPLSRLAQTLSERRQFLPLAVPFANRATVGGTIASGVDSPLRQFYGTARDYLLGMEFVTGEGKHVKSGGRVVKNVSGYDLHKLMIGSFGSLGVITKINFRTFPAPDATRMFTACFDSAADALALRQRVAESRLRPLSVEILSPPTIELLGSATADRITASELRQELPKGRWMFVTSFAGNESVLARYRRELENLSASTETMLLDENGATAALNRLREFIPIALDSSPATVIVKASVLPSRMAQTMDEMARVAEDEGLQWAAMARGAGVIYFALLPDANDEETAANAGRAIKDMFEASQRQQANLAIPWCPEEWKRRLPEAKPNESLDLTRKIKEAFDPRGVFAADPFLLWV